MVDVSFFDFFGRERVRDGNRSMEIIGVRGAKARYGSARLCPRSRKFGVGVDYSAYLREFAIKQKVGIQVAGWVECAFDD